MISGVCDADVLICGCGNILFGDDGFGPAVAQELNKQPLSSQVLVLDVGTSIREILFDLAISERRPRRIVIVDAVDEPGRQPGEVFEIDVEAIPAKKTADFSLHQFPTVNILKELRDATDTEVTVLVAQARCIPEEVQPGLSPEVAAAVPVACARLQESLPPG